MGEIQVRLLTIFLIDFFLGKYAIETLETISTSFKKDSLSLESKRMIHVLENEQGKILH